MLFNSIFFLLDLLALLVLWRTRKIWVAVATGALLAMAGVVLATLFVLLATEPSKFLFARLAAFGIFVHAPLLLFGTAAIWWKPRKWLSLSLAFAAAAILAVAGYAFLIEPFRLEITHYEIASPKIRRPVRIVVIADPQVEKFSAYEKRVLDEALAQRPDILLLAGDYLQTDSANHEQQLREFSAYLRQIGFSAPRGAFAIQGNVDGYGWEKMFADLNVTVVASRRYFDLDDLQLTCLGLGESFSPQTEVENPAPQKFHLVLGHVPNYALGKIDADLLLAGHTHGGQVRLPLVGALITQARVPRSWAAGLTDLPGGGQLLVSRGIGMERGNAPRVRFLCRPELAVIDLVPEGAVKK